MFEAKEGGGIESQCGGLGLLVVDVDSDETVAEGDLGRPGGMGRTAVREMG